MWLRTATDRKIVHFEKDISYSYIERGESIQYYFDESVAQKLEGDNFLDEIWRKFDAPLDWGDCDFFLPEKCIPFSKWIEEKLACTNDKDLQQVYGKMLEFSNIAIKYNTGLDFDF